MSSSLKSCIPGEQKHERERERERERETCFPFTFQSAGSPNQQFFHAVKGDKNFILLSWGYNLGGLVDELVDVVLAEAAVAGIVHAVDDAHGLRLVHRHHAHRL